MKRFIFILAVLVLLTGNVFADTMITDFTAETSPDTADLLWLTVDVSTSAADRKITLGNLLLWIATQDITWSGTWTGNIVGNASTATALASNPTDCSANQFANAIAASGNLTCAALTDADIPNTLTISTITLADDSTLTLPAAASAYDPGLFACASDGTCTWVDPATLLTSVDLSSVTISGGTASRMAEWDGSGNLTSSDTATTGTGAPVKGTGPTITLGENSTINNGASPTVNAAGEVAIDTTTDQFKYYGGAARVLPYIQYLSFVIPAPAEADDINIMKAPYGMTIIGINCIVQGTTSATGQLQECSATGGDCADLDSDIACDADGAADDGSLTDSAIASGAWLRWKTTSVADTPTFLTVTVRYSVVAD